MSSPITEVKPSQVAQLMKENEKLKEEIKTLKEEHKELNEEHEELKEDHQDLLDDIEDHPDYEECITSTIETAQKELKEEIETLREMRVDDKIYNEETISKLMKKNDELKQFAMNVHNFAFCTKYDDEDIVSSFDLDAILEEMKKDEDKLKEEIEELKKEGLKTALINRNNWETDAKQQKEIRELKEEIKKLKEENEDNEVGFSCLRAEKEFLDPRGNFTWLEDYDGFNNYLKENYNDDMYKKMYEWFDMDEHLDEDEDEDE